MEATTTIYQRQEAITAFMQDLNLALFHNSVVWIDRSEKTTRSYLTNLR